MKKKEEEYDSRWIHAPIAVISRVVYLLLFGLCLQSSETLNKSNINCACLYCIRIV